MAGTVLSASDRTCFPSVIEIDSFYGSARDSRNHSLSDYVAEAPSEKTGMGCVRGTTIALLFEAVTAFGIYGIWRLFHLLR